MTDTRRVAQFFGERYIKKNAALFVDDNWFELVDIDLEDLKAFVAEEERQTPNQGAKDASSQRHIKPKRLSLPPPPRTSSIRVKREIFSSDDEKLDVAPRKQPRIRVKAEEDTVGPGKLL